MKITNNYNPGQQEPAGRAGNAQSSSAAESSKAHVRDAHPASAGEPGHEDDAAKAAGRGTDAVIDRALEDAGVALSDRNRELVRSLLENTLPIDRNSIRAAMTEAASYSDTPAEVLALMHKNNIPVNSFSVSGFSEFLRAEQLMLSEMSEVIDSFSELLLSYPEGSEEYSALSQIASEILNGGAGSADSMTDAGADSVLTGTLGDSTLLQADGSATGPMTGAGADSALTGTLGDSTLLQADGSATGPMTGAGADSALTGTLGDSTLLQADGSATGPMTGAGADSAPAGTATASNAGTADGSAGAAILNSASTSTDSTSHAADTALLSSAQTSHTSGSGSPSVAGQVSGQAGPAGIGQNPANAQSAGISGNSGAASQDSASGFSSELNSASIVSAQPGQGSPSSASGSESALRPGAPLTPEGLKEALKNAFALKPDQINREQIRKMYERAESFLNKLKNIKSGDEESGLHGKVRHARNSLRLLKSINSFYPHAEIPIKFEDGRGTAQLYIYPDGHKRTPDPEHMSVLLHLNMPYLGMTDIRMRLDEKQLGLHFFAADKLSDSLLRADSGSLEQKLEGLGYLVKTAFSTGTAPFVNQTAENEADGTARPAAGEPAEEGTPVFSFDRRA